MQNNSPGTVYVSCRTKRNPDYLVEEKYLLVFKVAKILHEQGMRKPLNPVPEQTT